ncbi:MAG: ATP-grasp domain-containing protein [Proteobacteria bacterium]|nr:ATP-grasp domain-containing protein [Pseudomonadota bacterium]
MLIAPERSYHTGAFIAAAQTLGIRLVVASFGGACLAPVEGGLRLPSHSAEAALDLIAQECRRHPYGAILGSDDATVALAARAARDQGLPANGAQALKVSVDKLAFRQRCQQQGIRTPRFFVVEPGKTAQQALTGLPFPCVAKPTGLSASRGVIRCDDRAQLHAALARIRGLLKTEGKLAGAQILVEEYIDGEEFAIEALVREGRVDVLAIFEKPDRLAGPFFEETIYLTPPRLGEERVGQITTGLAELCQKLGFFHGPVHAEVRVNADELWFIEIASRTVGGRCGRLVEFQTGVRLESLVLANALGLPQSVTQSEDVCGVMMIPVPKGGLLRRVEGISAARAVAGIVDVEIDAREGQFLVPWPEGCAYPGFIFSRSHAFHTALAALREAHRHLQFVFAPTFPAQISRSASS